MLSLGKAMHLPIYYDLEKMETLGEREISGRLNESTKLELINMAATENTSKMHARLRLSKSDSHDIF